MSLIQMTMGRVIASIWIFLAVTAILFFAIETLPGDFASASAPRFTTWDQLESTRQRFGLNIAPIERYFTWLWESLQGEFGVSWYSGLDIASLLTSRLGHTALLACYAAILAIPLGFMVGLIAVVFLRSFFDRISSTLSLVAISLPEFLVAYALMTFFVVLIPVFPAHSVFTDSMPFIERIGLMTLPAISLAIVAIAPILRQTRAGLVSVLASDYIETAKLKGLNQWRLVIWHALPNTAGPIVNATMIVIANFFVGAVIVEQIFSFPGIGSLLISSVKYRDLPLILALGVVFSLIFITLNLIADLISLISNPRLRTQTAHHYAAPGLEFNITAFIQSRQTVVGCVIVFILALAWLMPESEVYFNDDTLESPGLERNKLSIEDLQSENGVESVHFGNFLPIGKHSDPDTLSAQIIIRQVTLERELAYDVDRTIGNFKLPVFAFNLFNHEKVALPSPRDRFVQTEDDQWKILLSAGLAWSESRDSGWNRVAIPFTLQQHGSASLFNGAMTFAYKAKETTKLRIQIAQEGRPDHPKMNFWGQGKILFKSIELEDKTQRVEQYQKETKTDFKVKPWTELESHYGRLREFDNDYIRQHVSLSGLLIDDTIYLRDCSTRFGINPFCQQLRHPVFSVSKSLGGAIGLLRLAQKYGAEVFKERILDYVPLTPQHDGWEKVTFGDALNMATGIGDLTPQRVDTYVESDFTPLEARIWNEPDVNEKLLLISRYKNYPWGPGEVTRYKSSETMLLAIAMDRFLKRKEGDQAGLWQMMVNEVYKPLGIKEIPTQMMLDNYPGPGVPQYGGGMAPNIQEVAKLAKLILNHGEFNGQQILHRKLTSRAISEGLDRGLPSGYRYEDGGMANYDMSFWLSPHEAKAGCVKRISMMVGYGGNYVVIMPNGHIGFRFADGRENVDATYDSHGIRKVSDQIKSFCGESL